MDEGARGDDPAHPPLIFFPLGRSPYGHFSAAFERDRPDAFRTPAAARDARRACADAWRKMPEADRAPFEELAEAELRASAELNLWGELWARREAARAAGRDPAGVDESTPEELDRIAKNHLKGYQCLSAFMHFAIAARMPTTWALTELRGIGWPPSPQHEAVNVKLKEAWLEMTDAERAPFVERAAEQRRAYVEWNNRGGWRGVFAARRAKAIAGGAISSAQMRFDRMRAAREAGAAAAPAAAGGADRSPRRAPRAEPVAGNRAKAAADRPPVDEEMRAGLARTYRFIDQMQRFLDRKRAAREAGAAGAPAAGAPAAGAPAAGAPAAGVPAAGAAAFARARTPRAELVARNRTKAAADRPADEAIRAVLARLARPGPA
jgi:hypothetical protein